MFTYQARSLAAADGSIVYRTANVYLTVSSPRLPAYTPPQLQMILSTVGLMYQLTPLQLRRFNERHKFDFVKEPCSSRRTGDGRYVERKHVGHREHYSDKPWAARH